ncbi:helix-turn-helix domain-containing protein [Curtobacterium sp. ER1/6]|uniref:helix-turn-helix domain-containing protein n=1 Tax=Curtobacterium sp. ER1/6 TaxID=1891920 RepID=UPI00084FB049|nr:helix-turn-helix domain-containing protein [Curtobacterium sp. ER1/6]
MDNTTNEGLRPLVSVSGTETDTAIADLAGMYAGKTWHSGHVDDDYWYRYVAVGDDRMSVRRSQMHGTLRGDVAVEGQVVVQWIDSGTATVDTGRNAVRMQPGIPVLFPVEQRFDMDYRDWDQRLVHLDRDLVLDVASERHLVDGTLAFDRTTPPTTAAVERWRASVASSVRVLRDEGTASLAWGEHRNARIRSAVETIHARAHEPLTVSEIARAADLSVRGLQESFQRTLDRTPMQYLREVRLRRAHDDLLRAEPATVSVAEVASRWGFTHMGRFSGEYLRRFGEYPKHTLRR